MKFELKIELGNETMATGNNVAAALVNLARKLVAHGKLKDQSGQIFDSDANLVGKWTVKS